MIQYQNLLKDVLENGELKTDRTGTGTISKFCTQHRYNLKEGFPLVTTKKTYFKGIVHELLWFLKGDTNIKYLVDNNVKIWNEWADENGDLGPVYGKQWRSWQVDKDNTVDQIKELINNLKENPHSRRHIISAWNVGQLDKMALPPCHMIFQFYVNNQNELSCHLYQRSGDLFLGVPFNIASYSLLTYMIAQVCNMDVGEFIHTIGDAHIYLNHKEQVLEQLSRTPKELPKILLNKDITNIDDFEYDDISLENYNPDPALKGKVSV